MVGGIVLCVGGPGEDCEFDDGSLSMSSKSFLILMLSKGAFSLLRITPSHVAVATESARTSDDS